MSTSLRIKLLLSLIISHLHISSLSVRLFKFPHPRVHDRSKFNLTLAEDLFEDRLRQGAIKKEKKKKGKKKISRAVGVVITGQSWHADIAISLMRLGQRDGTCKKFTRRLANGKRSSLWLTSEQNDGPGIAALIS